MRASADVLQTWQDFVALSAALPDVRESEVTSVLVKAAGLQEMADALWGQRLDQLLCQRTVPEFCRILSQAAPPTVGEEQEADRNFATVGAALRHADADFEAHVRLARAVDNAVTIFGTSSGRKPLEVVYRRSFIGRIVAQAPPAFQTQMHLFFRHTISRWSRQWQPGTSHQSQKKRPRPDEDEAADESALQPMEADEERSVGSSNDGGSASETETQELWAILHKHGWMAELRDVFREALQAEVAAYVRETCAGNFDTPLLTKVVLWKDGVLRQRLSELVCVPPFEYPAASATAAAAAWTSGPAPPTADAWAKSLEFLVHEVFCGARMLEAFDIVRDFPDSTWAVTDLSWALGATGLHWQFVAALREQVQRRLLLAGADTEAVLELLVCAVKALTILDPQGAMAEAVAAPIKRYLSGRSDTVRCVLRVLTDDPDADWKAELSNGILSSGGTAGLLEDALGDGDDEPREPVEGWLPVARPGGIGVGFGGSLAHIGGPVKMASAPPPPPKRDMLGMLVAIYGSKSVFVSEFRNMLMEWLLKNSSFDTTRELRVLEELKLRFGEESMKQCDVMVRDVDESKRINANVRDHLREHAAAVAAATPAESSGVAELLNVPFPPPVQHGSDAGRAGPSPAVVGLTHQVPAQPFGVSAGREASAGASYPSSLEHPLPLSPLVRPQHQQEQQQQQSIESESAMLLPVPVRRLQGEAEHGSAGARSILGAAADATGMLPLMPPPLASLLTTTAQQQQQQQQQPQPVSAVLISEHFWPTLPSGDLNFHPRMEEASKQFADAYQVLKNRQLSWQPQLGHLELELQLGGVQHTVTVAPMHAVLIMHFEDKAQWTAEELCEKVGASKAEVRRKMAFWVNLGLVSEASVGRYSVAAEPPRHGIQTDVRYDDSEDEDGAGEGGGGQLPGAGRPTNELDTIIENYLAGMLGNLGHLSAERMHNMLKMFMSHGEQRYNWALPDLVALLRRLCVAGRLEQSGNEYSLRRRREE